MQDKGIEADWEAFADAWRGLYQPSMDAVRTGARPWTRLDELHRESLLTLLDRFGITTLTDAEIDVFNRAWHRLPPWPDSVAGLERLKNRYILATLSNGNVSLLVNMARHSGLPWDVVLGAETSGHYKPMPGSYLGAAAMLDLPPEQCMMVAAHNNDLVAAASHGFRTAFISRSTEHGPNQTTDFKPEHDFDFAADSMENLATQLGC